MQLFPHKKTHNFYKF